jgi:glycosyltransferase involved in cell wall biosynthesis
MAAARGVIGTSAGGMAEIVEHGRTGLLVPPRDPKAIADAILALLRDPERRIAMGHAARAHVTTAYAPDVIAPLQEASYRRAIERAKVRRCGLSH